LTSPRRLRLAIPAARSTRDFEDTI
jgi:hypothetical protein